MTTLRFRGEDLALFAAASHDVNPLHMSDAYAHTTAFGQRAVFGVLGGLAALGHLSERPGMALAGLTLEFRNPLLMAIDYAVDVLSDAREQAKVRIVDAGRVLLTATATFQPLMSPAQPPGNGSDVHRAEPIDRELDACAEGVAASGRYQPSWPHLARLVEQSRLADRGIAAGQVAALLWCSYLIGMELPGRRATFFRLTLAWQPESAHLAGPMSYRARITKRDARFDLLHIDAELASGDRVVAHGQLAAFVRADSPSPLPAVIEAIVPRSGSLAGKLALVVGGSRGLGAAISQALALQGSTVLLTYRRSEAEAMRVAESVGDAPGRIELLRGDAANAGWCGQILPAIRNRYGGLDALICNASPAIQPLTFAPETLARFEEFVTRSLRLISAPMSAFLPALAARAGWSVLVSSAYVRTTPVDWPHYVTAKSAAEALVRWAAAKYPKVHFLIARPPKLLTDQTNTPLGQQGALAVERVAAVLARRLTQPPSAGIEVMGEF